MSGKLSSREGTALQASVKWLLTDGATCHDLAKLRDDIYVDALLNLHEGLKHSSMMACIDNL